MKSFRHELAEEDSRLRKLGELFQLYRRLRIIGEGLTFKEFVDFFEEARGRWETESQRL